MKKLLALAFLLFCGAAYGQQQQILCNLATLTPCTPTWSNYGIIGDKAANAFGKTNANVSQLYSMFGVSGLLRGNGSVPNPLTAATGADVLAALGLYTVPQNGQLLIGNGTFFSLNTLTAGSNVTITNGPGTITISASGGGGGAFQANGTPLTSTSTINFENSAATNGLTLSFSNPSAGNVQLGLSGVLTPAGGGMTWPSGGAGIPCYSGSSSWCTSYSATNQIPANFLAAPGFVAGTYISFSGSWPNLTINGVGPTGTAGVPCYAGSSSYCTTYNASNTIPANFLNLSAYGPLASANTWTATQTFSAIIDSALTPGTSPICPNGPSGAFTTSGCTTGSGSVSDGSGTSTANEFAVSTTTAHTISYATVGQGLACSGGACGTSAPIRTAASSTVVLSTDMGGQINMSVSGGGTLTIPAISSTVFAAGQTLSVVNYSTSTAAVSTTPTVNSGGGCVSGTGIPAGDSWQITSNGATLDCIQTTASASGSMVYPGAGIPQSTGSAWGTSITPGTGVVAALGTSVGSAGAFVTNLASGTQALGTSAISPGTCATTIQIAITGSTTSDTPNITYTTDPNTVTGYKASTTGSLYANAFMTSGELNIEVCNPSQSSITPSAMSVHYSVTSP